jgi:hypothetical protein
MELLENGARKKQKGGHGGPPRESIKINYQRGSRS